MSHPNGIPLRTNFSAISNAIRLLDSVTFFICLSFTFSVSKMDFIIISALIVILDVDQIEDFICCRSRP